MATPTYATTTEKAILAQARLELGLNDGTAEVLLLRRYLKQALKELRTPLMFKKDEQILTSTNGVFDLPDNFVSFTKGGSIYITNGNIPDQDGGGFSNGSTNTYPLASNNPFYSFDPSNNTNPSNWFPSFQVNDGMIYFSPGSNVTEIAIAYNAVRTDADGYWIIPANYERTLVAYCKWKYSQTFFREYTQDIRAEYKSEWISGRRNLKGMENLLTDTDRQLTTILMGSILG
jgi:hypothetical protein